MKGCIAEGVLQKLSLSMRGFGPPLNTWFLGPTRIYYPNGISIGSALFAQLMVMSNTNR